jgi:hypothetical protein
MNISISSYNNLSQSDDEWFCLNCSLPKFSDSFFEENVSIDVADLPQNTDLSDTQNPVQEPNKASEFEHNELKCLNKKGFLLTDLEQVPHGCFDGPGLEEMSPHVNKFKRVKRVLPFVYLGSSFWYLVKPLPLFIKLNSVRSIVGSNWMLVL